jgi:hypothetical protein
MLNIQITKTNNAFLKICRLLSFGYLDIQPYPRVDNVGYPNNQNIVGCGQVKTARTAKGLLVIWISNIIQGWIMLDIQITKTLSAAAR